MKNCLKFKPTSHGFTPLEITEISNKSISNLEIKQTCVRMRTMRRSPLPGWFTRRKFTEGRSSENEGGQVGKGDLSLTGFTLLEVMISLMILAVGLVSVFALFSSAVQAHRRGVRNAIVGFYAQAILAELESGIHPTSDTFQNLKNQTHSSFPDQYNYDLEFKKTTDQKDNAMVVIITIRWPHGRDFDSATFESVVLKK